MATYPAPSPPMIPARYKGGYQTPKALVIHGTVSADNAGTARRIAEWWAGPTSPKSSCHYTVDPREVIQSVGDHTVAYHCGSNSNCIGIELCDEQTGPANRWQDADSQAIIRRAARLAAELCLAYNISPWRPSVDDLKRKGKHGIYGHNDSRLAFGGTTHTDPRDFPWSQFMALVRQNINEIKGAAVIKKPKTFKLLHAPLHGSTATNAELRRALVRPGVVGVAFSEAYRHGGYLGRLITWRSVMGSGKRKDSRGRLVERDVILSVKRYRRHLSRRVVKASDASTPLKIAPERHLVYTVDKVHGKPLAMIGLHPNAAVREHWGSDRAASYRDSMQQLARIVGRLRTAYGKDLDIVVLGDLNYPDVKDGRYWAPRRTFERLGMKWVSHGIEWAAYTDGLRVVRAKVIPKSTSGQDHPWLEVEFRRA